MINLEKGRARRKAIAQLLLAHRGSRFTVAQVSEVLNIKNKCSVRYHLFALVRFNPGVFFWQDLRQQTGKRTHYFFAGEILVSK